MFGLPSALNATSPGVELPEHCNQGNILSVAHNPRDRAYRATFLMLQTDALVARKPQRVKPAPVWIVDRLSTPR